MVSLESFELVHLPHEESEKPFTDIFGSKYRGLPPLHAHKHSAAPQRFAFSSAVL